MGKIISVLKKACFSGKGCQLLHKMLISYVKLDQVQYLPIGGVEGG